MLLGRTSIVVNFYVDSYVKQMQTTTMAMQVQKTEANMMILGLRVLSALLDRRFDLGHGCVVDHLVIWVLCAWRRERTMTTPRPQHPLGQRRHPRPPRQSDHVLHMWLICRRWWQVRDVENSCSSATTGSRPAWLVACVGNGRTTTCSTSW